MLTGAAPRGEESIRHGRWWPARARSRSRGWVGRRPSCRRPSPASPSPAGGRLVGARRRRALCRRRSRARVGRRRRLVVVRRRRQPRARRPPALRVLGGRRGLAFADRGLACAVLATSGRLARRGVGLRCVLGAGVARLAFADGVVASPRRSRFGRSSPARRRSPVHRRRPRAASRLAALALGARRLVGRRRGLTLTDRRRSVGLPHRFGARRRLGGRRRIALADRGRRVRLGGPGRPLELGVLRRGISSVGWSTARPAGRATSPAAGGDLGLVLGLCQLAARGVGQRVTAVRAVVGGAAEEFAAVRALAADTRLADQDVAADVVQAQFELVQLGVHAPQTRHLGLAQLAVGGVLHVVRRAMELVDEAAEVAQQQFAGGAQERGAAAQLAAAGAQAGRGPELVGVQAGGKIGDRLGRGRRIDRPCAPKGGGAYGLGGCGAGTGGRSAGAAGSDRERAARRGWPAPDRERARVGLAGSAGGAGRGSDRERRRVRAGRLRTGAGDASASAASRRDRSRILGCARRGRGPPAERVDRRSAGAGRAAEPRAGRRTSPRPAAHPRAARASGQPGP